MRKHRLRCFFLSSIFIFYRRNSIGYDIVFRLCFCNSKNIIYFFDIQLFTPNTTKEETPWLIKCLLFQPFSARKYALRQRTSFVLMARPCEVPCTRTDVTLISSLHTHFVRALLWLRMFARRKVMKSNPCPGYWTNWTCQEV